MKTLQTNRGFTLIELLVVIAIIGMLASVVLASLNTARTKARDARRVADLKQLQTALEFYYDDKTAYPLTAAGLAPLATTYIPKIGKDPKGASYYYISTGQTFTLGATLENTSAITSPATCPTNAGNYCIKP